MNEKLPRRRTFSYTDCLAPKSSGKVERIITLGGLKSALKKQGLKQVGQVRD